MPDRDTPTILLVEDDPGHAKLIKKYLKRSGIQNEIIHLTNGRRAIDYLFSEGEYAGAEPSEQLLILLDLNMPELDGMQTLKIIKEHEKTRSTPVIMLTTSADRTEIEQCYELGCNVFITKPVEHEAFCEAIQKLGFFLNIVHAPQ